MTNADKIRAMSDEELLDVMLKEICILTGNEQYYGGDFCFDCKDCLWEWLKQGGGSVNCKDCDFKLCHYAGSDVDAYRINGMCAGVERELKKPTTNGDKIRAMTDEELAEILYNVGGDWYSEEKWVEWLKEEYDE